MKIKLLILTLLFSFSVLFQENDFPLKDFSDNGSLGALISSKDEQIYLIQLDTVNDSLVERALSILPDLELFAGPASYHRLLNENQYIRLRDNLSKDTYSVLDQNYQFPESRDYWALTMQGNQYNSSSGEINNSCMCLDASDCVVIGYNDSWYNPFDYYGEVSWSFTPPNYEEILEARVYVAGVQCDNLPLSSETTLSVKNNTCSWSDFQVTLSEGNTVNGPYIIPDDMINDLWCNGSFQPVIGSEDNYNVNWVQVELYYICETENPPENFNTSESEFCDYVDINWNPIENIDGYKLYRDGGLIMEFNSIETQYQDYLAQIDINHEYCITTLNECGESELICSTGSRKTVPFSSENIEVSNEFTDYIQVNWTMTDNTQYYYLYRDNSLLNISPNGELLEYVDEFVNINEVYEYCIESINDCGGSDWSCGSGSLASGIVGDINLDQEIDVLDIVILLNFILELQIPYDEQFWLSDINGDGILNILDIVLLVSYILDN